MQTFLPYSDFQKSAQCLDYRRLGKQRVEAKQILMVLLNLTDSKAWRNHPAIKMWRGHEGALARYGLEICKEWKKRGYKDNQESFFRFWATLGNNMPEWIGDKKFHASHRSNLLRKDKKFYSQYNWVESDDLRYVWPI